MVKKATRTTPSTDAPVPAKPRTRAKSSAPKPRKSTAADKSVGAVITKETSVLVVTLPEPTDEEIRLRAYHRYLERERTHGSEFDDWLEAKRDLLKTR
jgi:Protein of unknown function (DUF2934)